MGDLTVDQVVVQSSRGLGDRDDEAEVEQELERGRRTMRLVGIAAGHRDVPGPHRRFVVTAHGWPLNAGSAASR